MGRKGKGRNEKNQAQRWIKIYSPLTSSLSTLLTSLISLIHILFFFFFFLKSSILSQAICCKKGTVNLYKTELIFCIGPLEFCWRLYEALGLQISCYQMLGFFLISWKFHLLVLKLTIGHKWQADLLRQIWRQRNWQAVFQFLQEINSPLISYE